MIHCSSLLHNYLSRAWIHGQTGISYLRFGVMQQTNCSSYFQQTFITLRIKSPLRALTRTSHLVIVKYTAEYNFVNNRQI